MSKTKLILITKISVQLQTWTNISFSEVKEWKLNISFFKYIYQQTIRKRKFTTMEVCEAEAGSLKLTDLPVELLLHILQFLEVKFITEVLAEVSDIFR